VSVLGALLTLVLPEPARRSLDDISAQYDVVTAAEVMLTDADSRTTVPEG
jgi:hypothetical protein